MIINRIQPVEVRTDDGWVINVSRAYNKDTVELWIGKVEHGKFYSCYVDNGLLQLTETNESAQRTPTLEIMSTAWDGLINALQATKEKPQEIETATELKATKYHLEDMRSLVFKKGKI